MAPCDPLLIDQMIVFAEMLVMLARFQRDGTWNEQNADETDKFEVHWMILNN